MTPAAAVHHCRPRIHDGPRCRVIWTYYGPRKICRYRPWHHRHYRWHRRVWW
jgi:hypothetical protein